MCVSPIYNVPSYDQLLKPFLPQKCIWIIIRWNIFLNFKAIIFAVNPGSFSVEKCIKNLEKGVKEKVFFWLAYEYRYIKYSKSASNASENVFPL